MNRFSTFGFLNPFVQSRWKERSARWDGEAHKRRKRPALAMETRKGGSEVPSRSDDSAGRNGNAQGDS